MSKQSQKTRYKKSRRYKDKMFFKNCFHEGAAFWNKPKEELRYPTFDVIPPTPMPMQADTVCRTLDFAGVKIWLSPEEYRTINQLSEMWKIRRKIQFGI